MVTIFKYMHDIISAKSTPFSLQFLTDGFESEEEAKADGANSKGGSGFQLAYFMSSNGC